MKVQLGQILEMKEPLSRLTNEPLPLKIAFKLNKFVREVDINLTAIEEARVKLVKTLGVDDGMGVQVPKENIPKFQEEYVELMRESVELEFEPFDMEHFENAKITTQDMIKMSILFKE